VSPGSLLNERVGRLIGAELSGSVSSSFDTVESEDPDRTELLPNSPPAVASSMSSGCMLASIVVVLIASSLSQVSRQFGGGQVDSHLYWGLPIAVRGTSTPVVSMDGAAARPANALVAAPTQPTLGAGFRSSSWFGFLGRHRDALAAPAGRDDSTATALVEDAPKTVDDDTMDWVRSLRFDDKTPDEAYVIAEAHFNASIREPIRIAITGQSGVGKSTLTNTMRGLPPSARGAAPVSPTQMTGVRAPYQPEGYPALFHPGVIYYDLPGCVHVIFSGAEMLFLCHQLT